MSINRDRILAGIVVVSICCFTLSMTAVAKDKKEAVAAPQQCECQCGKKRKVEVMFVLDTTGSMSGLIDGAKKKIWSIANIIVDQNPNAEIYMGLVGYRDIGDDYVTKIDPLTKDIQGIYAKLLKFEANGGGDTPESVNEALDIAVTKGGWSESKNTKVERIIFLVGDAPPHMDYKQDRKYSEVIKEANQRGIIVNAIQAGDMTSTTTFWKDIAKLGNGEYLAIPQSGGRIIIIETPYDVLIQNIQMQINTPIIPYGDKRQQKEVAEKVKMYAEASLSESADMSSYVNKSMKGKNVVTGSGDMVADFDNKPESIDKLSKTELPENMQKMSEAERKTYLGKQSQERKKLSDELTKLVAKRDAYIAEQNSKRKSDEKYDSFDESVSRLLQKQIESVK